MEQGSSAEPRHARPGILPRRAGKILKAAADVFFALLLLLVAFLAFFLVRSRAAGGPPQIAGRYALVVLSGSMSPRFGTGSMVLVQPVSAGEIKQGDVITFKGFAGSEELTTHRVMEIRRNADGPEFITKGDANHAEDPDPVPGKNVIGRVTGSVPYLGYLMNFSQTQYGLLVLIVLPGILLILSEGRSLYLTCSAGRKKERDESRRGEPSAQTAGKE